MRKVLIGLLVLMCSIYGYVWNANRSEGPITYLDYAYTLESEVDTIEVNYLAWACACANWLPVGQVSDDTNCIFIEAANHSVLPEEFHNNEYTIKLVGKFYEDRGISRDYQKPTSQKPEHAKIFQYLYYEIL